MKPSAQLWRIAHVGRGDVGDAGLAHVERAGPLRAAEPLLAGHGVDVDAGRVEVDRRLTGALGGIDDQKGVVAVGQVGEFRQRHDRAGGPLDVRDDDGAGPGSYRLGQRGDDIAAAVADVDRADHHSVAEGDEAKGVEDSWMLEGGGDDFVAGLPADAHQGGVEPFG